jgi:hypothetical protein
MFTNPGITTNLATQDRELTSTPARLMARRVVSYLAAAAAAAAVLMTSLVGNAHLASGASHYAHFASGASYYAHFASGTGHFE